jgi:hypothetical protein
MASVRLLKDVAIFLLALLSCKSGGGSNSHVEEPNPYEVHIVSEKEEIRTLSSGSKLKVFGIVTQQLSGEPTLVITYGTKGDLSDVENLCREADVLWPEFHEDVEKSGLSRVTLSQTTVNDNGERTGGLTGVTYALNEDGIWCRVTGVPYEGQESWCFPPEK